MTELVPDPATDTEGDGGPSSSRFVRPARFIARHWAEIAGLVAYCVLAVALFSFNSPVSSSSLPHCACGDTAQEVWFLGWPAYALGHAANPFSTAFIAYPRGVDLMSSTSMPLLGTLASPVTVGLGPVATYNLLIRLAFALSAGSLFLVLRRWTTWWPAAFAGGLLYGFSPYMVSEGYSHLFLIFVPLLPLFLWLFDELLVRQRRSAVWIGGVIGLVACAQLLISAEVLASALLFALVGAVVLALRHPIGALERWRHVATGVISAGVTFVVLACYPLWEYVLGSRRVVGTQHPKSTYLTFHLDLASVVFPTSEQRFGFASWFQRGNDLIQGNLVEHGAYFGIPLIAAVVVITLCLRRNGLVVMSALLALGGLVLSLGAHVYVNGPERLDSLRLPYDVLLHVPLLDGLLDTRFALFAYLGCAVVLAFGLDAIRSRPTRRAGSRGAAQGLPSWTDGEDPGVARGHDAPTPGGLVSRRWRRVPSPARTVVALLVATVALLPLLPRASYDNVDLGVPQAFLTASVLQRIPAGSVLLPYPNSALPTVAVPKAPDASAMLWQAVTGMRFRIIGAYAAQPLPDGHVGQGDALFDSPALVQRLLGWGLYGFPAVAPPPPDNAATAAVIRGFLSRYHVATVVVEDVGVHPDVVIDYLTKAIGRGPVHVGGVAAWFDVNTS